MRPIIVIFVSYYLPGYKSGGPVQSIANLVEGLGDEFDFRIITSDRDLGDRRPYPNHPVKTWLPCGKAQVLYVSPDHKTLDVISKLLNEIPYDLIFLNSFFDFSFTTLPLLARRFGLLKARRPFILAPRGEFSPGALGLKAFKKLAFIAVGKLMGIHRDLVWLASTVHEERDIERVVGGVDVKRAADIRRAPNVPHRRKLENGAYERQSGDPLRVVFLSRLSPKKNLHYALEIMAKVKAPVTFTIYGPQEDQDYWDRCVVAIEAMPPHIEVIVAGPIEHSEVVQNLAKNDLFFLPTLGENYGHVIAEALEAGLRLLISDQTPWIDLAAKGVGYDLPLDNPEAFVNAIEHEASMLLSRKQRQEQKFYLEKEQNFELILNDHRELLSAVVSISSPSPK